MEEEEGRVDASWRSLGDALRGSRTLAPFVRAAAAQAMSAAGDELFRGIVKLVEEIVSRVERLEQGQREFAALALDLAELEAAHDSACDHQQEINQLLAYQLGGRLEKIKPPPNLQVVVDNTQGGPDAE